MTANYKGRRSPICPECGSLMLLKDDLRRTYPNGKPKKIYRCEHYPECRGTHGAHPDGTPLGIPVKESVRRLRNYVHVLADQIWPWEDKVKRKEMYAWLEKNTRSGHIGKMLEPELAELEQKLITLTAKLNQ